MIFHIGLNPRLKEEAKSQASEFITNKQTFTKIVKSKCRTLIHGTSWIYLNAAVGADSSSSLATVSINLVVLLRL